MNNQRIRDITFLQHCELCGYSAVGRQFGRSTSYEGDLEDQAAQCPVIAKDPHAECEHWRRATIHVKPE